MNWLPAGIGSAPTVNPIVSADLGAASDVVTQALIGVAFVVKGIPTIGIIAALHAASIVADRHIVVAEITACAAVIGMVFGVDTASVTIAQFRSAIGVANSRVADLTGIALVVAYTAVIAVLLKLDTLLAAACLPWSACGHVGF